MAILNIQQAMFLQTKFSLGFFIKLKLASSFAVTTAFFLY